eukprot:15245-Heterococcus_DN1.PRE.4
MSHLENCSLLENQLLLLAYCIKAAVEQLDSIQTHSHIKHSTPRLLSLQLVPTATATATATTTAASTCVCC